MARDFAEAFYHSKAWKTLRKQILRRDLYTCHDCTNRATEVHHIIELTPENINDPTISLNPDNLMSLCHDCHTKRTKKAGCVDDDYYFDEYGQVQKYKEKQYE